MAPSLPVGPGIPTLDDLTANLKTQIGFTSSRSDLSEDLMALTQTGMFEDVQADIKPIKGRKGKRQAVQVVLKFTTREFPPMESFRVDGASVLPKEVQDRVMAEYNKRGAGKVDMSTIALMKNVIEGWYQERGYAYSYITHFDGMEGGHVVANVTEGKVNSVKVVPVDDNGNPTDQSGLNLRMIEQDVKNTIKAVSAAAGA